MQIDKNTVSAKNQLKENEYISYINPNGKGKRILFVGNSITRHGIKPDIGWNNDFGMAASSKENDYVHILADRLEKLYSDAVVCICQASLWESNYKNGIDYHNYFTLARDFKADIIVMRIVENCKYQDFEHQLFCKNYKIFIDFLNSNNAEVILTSSFWKHPGDTDIEKIADERKYPFVYLGDLGENDDMKATGLFEHSGVAAHPGDNGMRVIADRIYRCVAKIN